MVARPRDLDRGPARSTSSSMPAPRTSTSPASPRPPAAAPSSTRSDDRALLALQGPEAAAVMRDLVPGRRRPRLHDVRLVRLRGRRRWSSRAPATPARTASRFSCRPTTPRRFWDRAARRRARQADRPRRPRLAPPRGRPAALRPRPRRDHLAGRGGPRLRRLASAAARPRDFPGAARILARTRRRPAPRPRRPAASRAGARPARAPRSSTPPAQPIGMVTTGGFGPTLGGPIAMGYVAARRSPRPAPSSPLPSAARTLPATVVPLPFVPHRYFRKPVLTRIDR